MPPRTKAPEERHFRKTPPENKNNKKSFFGLCWQNQPFKSNKRINMTGRHCSRLQ